MTPDEFPLGIRQNPLLMRFLESHCASRNHQGLLFSFLDWMGLGQGPGQGHGQGPGQGLGQRALAKALANALTRALARALTKALAKALPGQGQLL